MQLEASSRVSAPPYKALKHARTCYRLAGTLAVAVFDHAIERKWLCRLAGSRALTLSPAGPASLAPWIGAAGSARAT